eukprot:gene8026-8885_t
MDGKSKSLTRSIHDLHIEIKEEDGGYKIRPSSDCTSIEDSFTHSSSHAKSIEVGSEVIGGSDEYSQHGAFHDDVFRTDENYCEESEYIVVDLIEQSNVDEAVPKNVIIQVTEYEKSYAPEEESYTIFIDQNDSKGGLLVDDIDRDDLSTSFERSESGYSISFIDENSMSETRKLTLSADFTHSHEERLINKNMLAANINPENEEKDNEDRNEEVDEGQYRTSNSLRKRAKGRANINFKEQTKKAPTGYQLIFTDEKNPAEKSKLTLSSDLTVSYEERGDRNYSHLITDINIDDSDDDYCSIEISQDHGEILMNNYNTSTPQKNKNVTKEKSHEMNDNFQMLFAAKGDRKEAESLPIRQIICSEANEARRVLANGEPTTSSKDEKTHEFPSSEQATTNAMSEESRARFHERFLKILRVDNETSIDNSDSVTTNQDDTNAKKDLAGLNSITQKQELSCRPAEEEENVDLGPLWLPPVDSFSVDDDSDIKIIQTPGGLNNMDTRETVPVEEGVISEAYSEGNTENEIALESIFQDEKEEDDNEENRSLSPTNVLEPTNIEPTLEQDTDEFTMRTLCIESVPPELEEDELIDLKRNDEPKKFTIMKLKDEKPPKNLVRTLSNKVKGSIKNIFSSRDNLNEEDLSDDERTADVESVNLGPLSLAPIEYTEMDSKDKVSLVYHFEDDANAREAKPIEENVITEEHDEGDTETEVQLDSIFCDDEQPDENQDSAFSPQFHELGKSESEPTTEQETTELSTRTVHRLVIPERIADDDDLSDLKTGDEPIEYTLMNVKDEDPPKKLVRSLSRKVTGSIKRLFGSRDNLDEEDSSLLENDEEEENVDLGPLWIPPVDFFSVDDDSDIKIIPTPGGLNIMDTRETVPVEEGVISEAYSEGNTENEIALESIFQDEKEEDDHEENRFLSPTNVLESTNSEPTLEQDTDEFTMRTLCIESVPPEMEEDELIDLKRNDEPKKFTIMKLKDEKPPKNLVRTLSNKVKGSIKNIFSSRDNLNEEDLSDDERTADVESVNLGPLSLAPIEYTEMDSKDKVSLVYHFEDDDNAREAKPIEENVITEEHDEGDTETEVQLDSIFCEDEQPDENQDSAFSPQFHELDKSESEPTTEQETTELSTRTVHRLVIPERIADDDDLSDLKTGDEPIEYTVMNVKDEDPSKNLVRSLSRKVTGSIKRLFGSRDNLDEEDSSLLENDEEEENVDLGPLWLPPVDSFSVDDDSDIKIIQAPGGLNNMDTRETVPVEEGAISEAYSEGNTENEIALESIFQDEKEEDDNEENRSLSPTNVLEPTNIEPTLEQDTDEFTMRTLCIESVPPELEEDELIDLKRNDEPKKFTIMKLKDEKPPKNLVRTLSNKVKGSIKNIFSSRDNLNEEDLSDDERTADVESVNLGPLSLAPIEYTEMDSKDKVSLVYHFEDDDNAREAKPIEENVITEEHDEGDTETEVQLDSIFCDDEQPDENQDSAFSPQFHELDKSESEPTTEQETTELSTRTVHRLVIPERIADDDDLSDLKTGDEPIEYTVMNVKDEDPPKNLVRSLSRKVTGSIKRLFGSRDNLDEEDSSLLENDEEEENVDLGPLWLPPVDSFSVDDDSDIKIIQAPGGLNNMDTRETVPVEEGVISEAYSEGNTENEIALESIFQDEKEEDDNEENRSLSPTSVLEPTNIEPTLEQDTDEFTMRTLCIESVPPELEEDELIDLKRNDEPKKFTIMKLKDEKPPKNLVRTLSNKVKGSIKNIFSSRDNLNEEDLSDDERTADVESVNLGPLSLAPIEYTEMDSKDKVSLVYHFEDDANAREAKPMEENVITEEHDEGDTETEVQLDSIFCDDEQPDENQDSAFSPQFHELDKSESEPTTEQETTELSTRTVHRLVIPERIADDDDLSDLKTGDEPIEYTVMNVKDEDPPKKLVRSLSRKVTGSIKRLFGSRDNLDEEDSSLLENDEEEENVDLGPLWLPPVDSFSVDDDSDIKIIQAPGGLNNMDTRETVPVEEGAISEAYSEGNTENEIALESIFQDEKEEDDHEENRFCHQRMYSNQRTVNQR